MSIFEIVSILIVSVFVIAVIISSLGQTIEAFMGWKSQSFSEFVKLLRGKKKPVLLSREVRLEREKWKKIVTSLILLIIVLVWLVSSGGKTSRSRQETCQRYCYYVEKDLRECEITCGE